MKCTLLVVTLIYTTMTCASAPVNKASLEKRLAQNQTHISTLSQNIKSGNTDQIKTGIKTNSTCTNKCGNSGCQLQ